MNNAENGVSGNLQALFQEGLEAHQSGHLSDAEAAYRKILDAVPGHADTNHLLGVIALQVGDFAAAVEMIAKAIEITPTASAYHCNLGSALYELGRLDEAAASQQQAITLDPDYAKAHNNLGNVRLAQERFEDAVASYRKAVALNPGNAEAHTTLGNILQETGHLEDAIASHRNALEINSGYAEAHTNLGNTLKDMGRLEDAVNSYRKAIDLNPDLAGAHTNLGLVLQSQGLVEDAAASHQRAIEIDSEYAEAHTNLGNTWRELGRLEDATAAHEKALAIRPNYAEALNNLGNVLMTRKRPIDAIPHYRKAVSLSPELFEAHTNLGNALKETGEMDEAIASHQRALALNPDYAETHISLGNVFKDMGRLDAAVASYEHAISLNPDLAGAHTNLGSALKELGHLENAIKSHEKAISLNPDLPEAHSNLGTALQEQGHLEDAATAHKKALALKPDFLVALNNLGGVKTDLGDLEEAIALYKQAFTLKPDFSGARCNYLHTLLYLPDITNNDLFDAYREAVLSDPSISEADDGAIQPPPDLTLSPGERLRIGYISSDLGNHPVGKVVLPLLSQHDHERYEIFCYAELSTEDGLTERFRDDADHWRMIKGLSDAEVSRRIRDDGIHVMVYLGGHFNENRPSVAIFRPAPVQVAMHGGATTALDEMDYWLTDAVLHPDTTTELFSEELFRLPNFYAWPILEDAPPVSELPAEDNGFVTFASFNKPCKINPVVIALWSRVLAAAPQSRLMLKFKNHWDCPTLKDNLLGRFENNGISPDRIDLISAIDTFHDHLACYHKADIALDLFPFAGATTTFQALWMGVPVVSRMGDRFSSRAGGSMSTHTGLSDLAVESDNAFVEQAVALAADLPRLADLRATLRQRVENSPLCDGPAYARNVEDAFHAMWDVHAGGGKDRTP